MGQSATEGAGSDLGRGQPDLTRLSSLCLPDRGPLAIPLAPPSGRVLRLAPTPGPGGHSSLWPEETEGPGLGEQVL